MAKKTKLPTKVKSSTQRMRDVRADTKAKHEEAREAKRKRSRKAKSRAERAGDSSLADELRYSSEE